MNSQLALVYQAEPAKPAKPPPRTIAEHFAAFHLENPEVYRHFCRFAFEVVAAGRARYSARAIIHRIRWHLAIEIRSLDTFRINNNFSPYYARMFLAENPGLAGFFELREAAVPNQNAPAGNVGIGEHHGN